MCSTHRYRYLLRYIIAAVAGLTVVYMVLLKTSSTCATTIQDKNVRPASPDRAFSIDTKVTSTIKNRNRPRSQNRVQFHSDMNVLRAENISGLECVKTITKPPFLACLLPVSNSDESKRILKTKSMVGSVENYVSLHIARALRIYPDATFIDGGANIGFYATFAAAMGHDAIAVEPMPFTARCLQKNLFVNNFKGRLTVLNNALSDERTTLNLSAKVAGKMGTVRVIPQSQNTKKRTVQKIKTILIDDMIAIVQTKSVVIKLDIQGHECKALAGATELMKSFHVPYIFAEWSGLVKYKDAPGTACDSSFLNSTVNRLYAAGYKPYTYSSNVDIQLEYKQLVSNPSVLNMYWIYKNEPSLE